MSKLVTGVYSVGITRNREVILTGTNPEDISGDVSKPRKMERVVLAEYYSDGGDAIIARAIVGDEFSLTSGLAERNGEVVVGKEEDDDFAARELAREIKEERGLPIDHRRLVRLGKVSGNHGNREQIVDQIRDNSEIGIWSVGFWFYLTEDEIDILRHDQQVIKIPIDKLALFIRENEQKLRPSTIFFLWELLKYELEMV